MTLSSRSYKAVPEIVAGYSLNKLQFSVIVPIERTNLILNPSFETNTTGYTAVDGATLTRTTETQRRGVFSLRIKPGVSSVSGVFYTSSALVAGNTYAFSLDVNIRGGRQFQVRVFDGARSLVTKAIRGKGYWERIAIVFTAVTSGAHRFYFEKNGDGNNTTTDNVFTDGWQLELCEAGNYWETTYIDGDQSGFVINQFPPAYYWNGTPNASTSVRSGQTRSGGQKMNLSQFGLRIMAVIGLGMSPVSNSAIDYALIGGANYQRTTEESRAFTLVGRVSGENKTVLQNNRDDLIDVFRPDVTGTDQPLLLTIQNIDDTCQPIGDEIQISCLYRSGLEGRFDNYNGENVGLQFVNYDTNLASVGNSGSLLNYASTVLNANNLLRRFPDGTWDSLGVGANNFILTVAVGPDGKLYAGGAFTSIGGITVQGIARWNGTAWEKVGTGAGANNTVYSIAFDANGAVYISGDFTSVDGVAASRIAKFDGSSWSALGAGLNGQTRALAFANNGILYAGGVFTTAGGGAAANIAQWNGTAWSALSSGVNNTVLSLAVGPDGYLYIGGLFTIAGGAFINCIVRWNGSAFSALGVATGTNAGVYTIDFGPNGILYAGGDFSTIGGVSANLLGYWNGTTWAPFGAQIVGTGVRKLIALPNGLVYVGGIGFTSAGGVSLINSLAVWNGTNWAPTDIIIPGAPTLWGADFGPDGILYIGWFSSMSSATASGITTVANSSQKSVSPTIRIFGSGTLISIVNSTNGKALYFNNLTLLAGEILTLVLQNGAISFTSNFRGNVLSYISPASNLSDFVLQTGNNKITALMVSGGPAASISMMWRNSYWSIDGLASR